jgi:hypothetical protein
MDLYQDLQYQINKLQMLKNCFLIRLYVSKQDFSKLSLKEKNEVEIVRLKTEMELSKIDNKIKLLVFNYRQFIQDDVF